MMKAEIIEYLDSIRHSLYSGDEITKEQIEGLVKVIDYMKGVGEQTLCKDCLHYQHGAHLENGSEIPGAGFCGLIERVFLETDYCSYAVRCGKDDE